MSDVTVVGVFRNDDAARTALRQMDAAGFPPDRVGIVAGNVRQAREVAGSFSPTAAVIGAVIGALVGLGFGLASGMSVNGPAATVAGVAMFAMAGVAMFAMIGAFIGTLAGRAKGLKPHDYEKYERAVEMGDALVTIRCTSSQQDQARRALQTAGATAVRIEDTPETI